MKRYSLFIMVTLAVLLAFAVGSMVVAGDKSGAKNDPALNSSSSAKPCPMDCKDKAECSKACTAHNGGNQVQCPDSCKVACANKTACAGRQSGPCKPGDCKQAPCKATPGK